MFESCMLFCDIWKNFIQRNQLGTFLFWSLNAIIVPQYVQLSISIESLDAKWLFSIQDSYSIMLRYLIAKWTPNLKIILFVNYSGTDATLNNLWIWWNRSQWKQYNLLFYSLRLQQHCTYWTPPFPSSCLIRKLTACSSHYMWDLIAERMPHLTRHSVHCIYFWLCLRDVCYWAMASWAAKHLRYWFQTNDGLYNTKKEMLWMQLSFSSSSPVVDTQLWLNMMLHRFVSMNQ